MTNQQGQPTGTAEPGPDSIPTRFWLIIGLSGLVFLLALVPIVWEILRVTYYYLALLFSVFLGSSLSLLYLTVPRSETRNAERDYRVIHYALRLSLALGIGAILIAALFLAKLLEILT